MPKLLAIVLALLQVGANLAPTGTLRAAFIADNPVQGRVDPKTEAISGPAADLTRELARRLGVPSAIMPVADAGAVITTITSGNADIGFLAFEAARATEVDFSDQYSLSGSTYAVRANSSITHSADVDRAGLTIGAVAGQSPQVWVSEHVQRARIETMPVVPELPALAAMLLDGRLDAFAANRTRLGELVRAYPALRVLPDNFTVIGQAVVVKKGSPARVDALNRFLADVRASGFVKASLDRANLAGVEVATPAER